MNRAQRRQTSARTRKQTRPADPQSLKVQAARQFQAGQLRDCERLCEQLLKALPQDGDTLHLLGALRLRERRAREAVALLEQALGNNAHKISCTRNLAQAYAHAGQLEQAIHAAYGLVALQDTTENQALLAGFLLQDGQAAAALPLCAAVYQHKPTAEATARYARALMALNRLEEAEAFLVAGLAAAPGQPEMVRTLAKIHEMQGKPDAARDVLQQACRITPQAAELWVALAGLHETAGAIPQAEAVLAEAVRRIPAHAALWHTLALLRSQQGHFADAIAAHRQAVRLEPLNVPFWNAYGLTLQQMQELPHDTAALETDLLTLFALPTAHHAAALQTAVRLLQANPVFRQLVGAAQDRMAFARLLDQEATRRFLSSPLLIQVLQSIFVPYRPFEQVFSALRRILLQCAALGDFRNFEMPLPEALVYALAHQCFLNEYAWWVGPDEKPQLESLAAALQEGKAPDRRLVALYGCYVPLGRCGSARAFLRHPEARAHPAFAFLLRRQINEPLEERKLMAGLPQLTPIEGGVSSSVQAMYEENPYPRWDTFMVQQPTPFGMYWRLQCPWIPASEIAEVATPRILIAGCGTGRHAFQTASIFRGAEVLAVDLSRASLAFARRKQQELNLRNVTLAQGDILKLGSLGQQFDQIESAGVLHHMADPVAGWRVLLGLLKPGGFMRIALYSTRARRNVVAARRMIAAGGYPATADGIRQWRQDVMQMPVPDKEAVSPRHVMTFNDFFSLSMCRDLAFHVQEHTFALPQLAAILEELGLEFLGFEFQNSHPAPRLYAERFSQDRYRLSLANWAVFEEEFPDTFQAMYQFGVRKKPIVHTP